MTKLDRASDAEFEARIKRRKRIGADLGLVAAGTTAAGIGIKGGGMAAKKLAPLATNAAKAEKIVNRSSGAAVTAAGASGATAGINNSLVTNAELKRREGKRKDVYRVKRQLQSIEKGLNDSRKKYFYQNNVEQRRNMRNKAYPGAAAAGSVVAAGAAGGLAYGNRKKSKYVRQESSFAQTRDANKHGADQSRKIANSYRAQIPVHEKESARAFRIKNQAKDNAPNVKNKAGNRATQRKWKLAGKKALRLRNMASDNVKAANKHVSDAEARSATAEHNRLQTVKTLSQKRYAKLPGKKATLAVAGASVGLAGLAAASRRNNKKGVTRPRSDWWQG